MRVDASTTRSATCPRTSIRLYLCWGKNWHGLHTGDIPMAEIVETMLAVNAKYYSFEAANVRHEHEWRVWRDVKLPEGKVLLPGIVSHCDHVVVEHPQKSLGLRIVRFRRGASGART